MNLEGQNQHLEGRKDYLEGGNDHLEGTWRSATLQVKVFYPQEVTPENDQLGGEFQEGRGVFCAIR